MLCAVPPGRAAQPAERPRPPPARCPPLPAGLAPAPSALSLCAPAPRRPREQPPRSAGRERRGRRRHAVRAFGGRASRASPSRTASPHGHEFGNSHGSSVRGTSLVSAALPGEEVSLGRRERGRGQTPTRGVSLGFYDIFMRVSHFWRAEVGVVALCAPAELGAGVWK